MRKIQNASLAMMMMLAIACGDRAAKVEPDQTANETGSSVTTDAPPAANQPKSYQVSISPDSAILGKSSEVLVRFMGGTAVALSDPDGKDNGVELIIKMQATNRHQIDQGGSISVSYENARLLLDNGNSIPAYTGTDYLRAQPESTSKLESWTFQIPAGAKPATLSLFLDGTRVSTAVTFK